MKKKSKKKEKKAVLAPLSLPEEQLRTQTEGEIPLRVRTVSGKWSAKSTVAWNVSLPVMSHPEDDAWLLRLRDAFLRFLLAEAEKERDEVWFGGMEWEQAPSELILKTAYCPFSKREYRKRAVITCTESGAVSRIRFFSQSSGKKESESSPSQALSSAQRQSAGQGDR